MDILAFLTWQFIFFSLSVMAVLFVIRRTVEYFIPRAKVAKFWGEFLLPILPIILGGAMGIILKAYPYATGFTSPGTHVMFGMVAGLMSGLVYKVIKGMLGDKIQNMVGAVVASNLTTNNTSATDNADQLGEQVRQTINKQQ